MDCDHPYSQDVSLEEWHRGDDFGDKANKLVEFLNSLNGVDCPKQLRVIDYIYQGIWLIGQSGNKEWFRTSNDRPIGANIPRWESGEIVTANKLNAIVAAVSRISGIRPATQVSYNIAPNPRPIDSDTQYAVSISQSGPTLSWWNEGEDLEADKLNEPVKILNSFCGINPPRQFVSIQ